MLLVISREWDFSIHALRYSLAFSKVGIYAYNFIKNTHPVILPPPTTILHLYTLESTTSG